MAEIRNTFNTARDSVQGNLVNSATGTAFSERVGSQGREADSNFKSNSQDRLQRGLSDIATSLKESEMMEAANRQASKEMALDANKTALNDACNKNLSQSGSSFKAAAGS